MYSLEKEVKVLYHITGYKDPLQFAWLFDAIYNEQDIYVIHVDRNSPKDIHAKYHLYAGHHQNVFFLPSSPVTWGAVSYTHLTLPTIYSV